MIIFAPPKGGKLRDVPLPEPIADAIRRHIERFPPADVTRPWGNVNGLLVTKRLIFTQENGELVRRPSFNSVHGRTALVQAGVTPERRRGEPHQAAREHGIHALRHFYASVLPDVGENIKALSEYLGHHDPGFTLRTYTHLMPSSQERTRKAVGAVFGLEAAV